MLPGLALAYLWAAPTTPWRRVRQLLAGGLAIVVSAGWWLAGRRAVAGARAARTSAGRRPTARWSWRSGYNGLGRIFGGQGNGGRGRVPGGAEAAGAMPDAARPGPPGVPGAGSRRRPGGAVPAASAARPAHAAVQRRDRRPDHLAAARGADPAGRRPVADAPALARGRDRRARAALLLWGGWTVVSALVFSLMEGTFHAYYTVALAPGVAALVAIGAREAWRVRDTWTGRGVLALATAVTAVWAWVLLGRSATFLPWLRWVVLAVGAVAAVGAAPAGRGGAGSRGASRRSSPVRRCSPGWPDRRRTPCRRPRPRTRAASCRRGRARAPGSGRAGGCAAGRTATRRTTGDGTARAQEAPSRHRAAAGRTGGPHSERRPGGAGRAAGLRAGRPRERADRHGPRRPVDLGEHPLGGGDDRLPGRGVHGAQHGDGGHGDRRLRRQRPVPDAAAVPAVRRERRDPLLRRGRRRGPGRRDSEIATWVRQHYSAQTVDGRTVYDLTAPAS